MNIDDYKDTGKVYGISSISVLKHIDTGNYMLYDTLEGIAYEVKQKVTKDRIEEMF